MSPNFSSRLQELVTNVPFRCIDEINQGMDLANELIVWTMFREAAQRSQSQVRISFLKNLKTFQNILILRHYPHPRHFIGKGRFLHCDFPP